VKVKVLVKGSQSLVAPVICFVLLRARVRTCIALCYIVYIIVRCLRKGRKYLYDTYRCDILSAFSTAFCTALWCIHYDPLINHPHCTILLQYVTLNCTALHCTVLHCTTPYCTAVYHTTPYHTALRTTLIYDMIPYYIALFCSTLHYTALLYTTSHYTTLNCTALHLTTFIYLRKLQVCSSHSILN
jgi:hypothetical protein